MRLPVDPPFQAVEGRSDAVNQAEVGNGLQCTEGFSSGSISILCCPWLQSHLQPSLQDLPLAVTADINNPSPPPPAHRLGRIYLKQAPAETIKGCLKMAPVGCEAGACPRPG